MENAIYEIVEAENKTQVTEFFKNENEQVKSMLDKIRSKFLEQADDDISTAKSRKYIVSLAADVRKTKVVIDNAGKELVAELKALPKQIDASRKEIRDSLDKLAEEIREPVTKWEEEQERLKQLEEIRLREIELIKSYPTKLIGQTSQNIQKYIDAFNPPDQDLMQGKYKEAEALFNESMILCQNALKQAIAAEEAEKLRKEKEQREREEQIRKEAEEKARKETELAELKAKEAEARAIEAEKMAEQKAKEAAEKAKQEEIERQKAEEQKRLDEERAREADLENKKRIATKIVAALVAEGLEISQAKMVSQALFRGRIPHTKVVY